MKQRYLIVDVDLRANESEELVQLGFKLLRPQLMSDQLMTWSGWAEFDRDQTLLVMPGNGAVRVASYLPEQWLEGWKVRQVDAHRMWVPGSDPFAFVGRIDTAMLLGLRNVVVLEDVVSSGSTIRKIRQINLPWIPNVHWHVASWVRQAAASTKGFVMVEESVLVGTQSKKASVNSLSTLIEDRELAQSYATRKLMDLAERFFHLLEQIRNRSLNR
ncbi:MAG: hypothetical protein Q8P83_02860 [bacterium]|nr:hypothetical protein [bacterium]